MLQTLTVTLGKHFWLTLYLISICSFYWMIHYLSLRRQWHLSIWNPTSQLSSLLLVASIVGARSSASNIMSGWKRDSMGGTSMLMMSRWGQGKLSSKTCGNIPSDMSIYTSSSRVCYAYPLGRLFIRIPSSQPDLKHLFNVLLSLFFLMPILQVPFDVAQILASVLGTYFLVAKIKSLNMPWIVFVYIDFEHWPLPSTDFWEGSQQDVEQITIERNGQPHFMIELTRLLFISDNLHGRGTTVWEDVILKQGIPGKAAEMSEKAKWNERVVVKDSWIDPFQKYMEGMILTMLWKEHIGQGSPSIFLSQQDYHC